MKRILFHSNQLSLRGTEIALFDYASFAEEILGYESVIAYPSGNINTHPLAINKFKARFPVYEYNGIGELNRLIQKEGIDLTYAIKSGEKDFLIRCDAPLMVHAVFPQSPLQVHGSSYAFVSEWLSDVCSNHIIPAVPHIIELPQIESNLRNILNIPNNSLVIGSYGGELSFDIEFVKEEIAKLLDNRNDLFFVFLNIRPFAKHERCLFLPGTSDSNYKVEFINTCDAMIHARLLGESFGLSCGEFSIKNRPVITYGKSSQTNHIKILGSKGLLYNNASDLQNIILNLDRQEIHQQSWDCYSEQFNPKAVMTLFDQHLIQPALNNGLNTCHFDFSMKDHWVIAQSRLKTKLTKKYPMLFA